MGGSAAGAAMLIGWLAGEILCRHEVAVSTPQAPRLDDSRAENTPRTKIRPAGPVCFCCWHREQPEAFRQGIERGYSVRDLDLHRSYLAPALDCVLDAEAFDSPVSTLGQLVGLKQFPLRLKRAPGS